MLKVCVIVGVYSYNKFSQLQIMVFAFQEIIEFILKESFWTLRS